jgi:DNA repair exonuclease SbcCD ATPase subunit
MPNDNEGEMPEKEVKQEIEQPAAEMEPEEFDKERAMETIKKQRESERRALATAEKLQKELEKYQEAERKQKEAEMTETDKLKAELAEREAKLKSLELAQLQRQAADKFNLPAEFANRLKGETLEELETDAEAIAKLLPKKQVTQPPVNPGDNASGKGTTEDDLRAQIYGLRGNQVFDPSVAAQHGGGVIWVDKNKS